MLVVGEELDFGDAREVLLQVGDEFARANFPHANFAFYTARAEEFAIPCETDSSYASLVCILYLPQLFTGVDSESADDPIRPATQNQLICEDGAVRVQILTWFVSVSWRDTPSLDRVVVGVPQTHSAIF